MGRVYDALKRARSGEEPDASAAKKNNNNSERRNGSSPSKNAKTGPPSQKKADEHPWDSSPLFSAEAGAAHSSASTAHTDALTGSALPGGMASRDAGATLGAAGSARSVEFVSLDISAERVEPHLVAVTQPRSPYCEQFRSLRTRVLQAGERRKIQAFVITSAGIAEGKTLTALNLAWLLAQTDGVRALLIDSDLRQPCATDYLGVDLPYGLSEVLGGEATLQQAIRKLEPAGLYLLPGGAAREDVAEILSGPKFGALLAELRRMFDYIIIDAPPLGIFTDANLLINRADSALLVVRAGKTRYSAIERLLEQIPRERLLGVILNRADEQLNESDYYYQRRYYRRESTAAMGKDTKAILKTEEEVQVVS
ncbi:MAG TPA: CpsD/CapB family tyrosine-protein kinase [Pyrinomonadaceae bacterium]|jgi:capsular exopolysaccharide synthesis family protein|nr:CpsD/CapB family tyrosine-protein kinase [Pyrinomonadaceae bacterium]